MHTLFGSRFRRLLVIIAAVAIVATSNSDVRAQFTQRLLPRDQIARMGLTRDWFAQVELDSTRSHVERAILSGDRLFVLTSAGTLHALNAETGETMWVAPHGNPDHPSLGPTANEEQVAFVNGSTLYVLNRTDGQPVIVRHIGGATGAAPAMSRTYCFVPMLTGRIEGYPMRNQELPPWFYQSYGRAMTAPLVTDSSVVWSTDNGHVYVANAIAPAVRYRVETGSEIVATPSYRAPIIYVATVAGEVIAMHETSGLELWKFAAEYPILRSPATVGGRVFVTSLKPALYAIDAASGDTLWSATKIAQFAAASRERVYAMNSLGALVVLDAASGAKLDRMNTDGTLTALVNDQTDRIYLVSDDGKVQCLHELGADAPFYHSPRPAAAPTDGESTAPAGTAPAQPAQPAVAPAADENPFGPFGGGAPAPAGGQQPPAADENPFGPFGGG